MRRTLWGRVRLVSVALVGLIATCGIVTSAQADAARDQCKAEARGRVAAMNAKLTPEKREEIKALSVALGFLAGGIFNAAREASTTKEDIDRQLFRKWERECLSGKGLEPLPEAAPASTSAGKGKSEGRTAGVESQTGLSKSGNYCACKQMTTCSGSWARLSCGQLTERCRNPRTPRDYVQNSCDKLKQLVGGF